MGNEFHHPAAWLRCAGGGGWCDRTPRWRAGTAEHPHTARTAGWRRMCGERHHAVNPVPPIVANLRKRQPR